MFERPNEVGKQPRPRDSLKLGDTKFFHRHAHALNFIGSMLRERTRLPFSDLSTSLSMDDRTNHFCHAGIRFIHIDVVGYEDVSCTDRDAA